MAEFNRSLIKEAQAEGIAKAKKQGKHKGRKPALDNLQKISCLSDFNQVKS